MQKATKLQRFFFFTYAAFLLPSIPHIASFFLAFEGNVQGYELWFWVVVSYLIAIAIDGTLLWLTHTVARDTTHKWGYHVVIWLFILFLVGFSGFLNWHIAKHNAPLASQQLSGAFIPDVDPIVASLFPVLAIMYAVMSRHVFADVKTDKPKSIEELEAEAQMAERKGTALARINAANDQQKTSWIKGKIGIVQNAFKNDSSEKKEQNTDPVENVALPSGGTIAENTQVEDTTPERIPDVPVAEYQEKRSKDESEVVEVQEDTAKHRAISGVTITFEEAAEMTGYSVSTLKKYASQGKVKKSKRDENLLLLSSLTGMKNKAKSSQTGKLPVLELVGNHHQNGAQKNGL